MTRDSNKRLVIYVDRGVTLQRDEGTGYRGKIDQTVSTPNNRNNIFFVVRLAGLHNRNNTYSYVLYNMSHSHSSVSAYRIEIKYLRISTFFCRTSVVKGC